MQGFLLGLSTGLYCFASCGLLLAPFLLAEAQGPGKNVLYLLLFLLGRLAGYTAAGAGAWLAGRIFFGAAPAWRAYVFGTAYIALAAMLLVYAVRSSRCSECCGAGTKLAPGLERPQRQGRLLIPLIGGMATGFNVCPPFMLAFAAAAAQPTLAAGVGLFLMFYAGTSFFLLLLPMLGLLRRHGALRTIGLFSAGFVGVFYLYSGLALIIQGGAGR